VESYQRRSLGFMLQDDDMSPSFPDYLNIICVYINNSSHARNMFFHTPTAATSSVPEVNNSCTVYVTIAVTLPLLRRCQPRMLLHLCFDDLSILLFYKLPFFDDDRRPDKTSGDKTSGDKTSGDKTSVDKTSVDNTSVGTKRP
jgi:hypothetical protein